MISRSPNRIGDEPAPRKWLHSKSRRFHSTLPVPRRGPPCPAIRTSRRRARLGDRRRRGVGVEGVGVLRLRDLEQLQVVDDLPLSRSSATTPSALPSGVAVVIQTCSPRTIGDDQARPWIAVFHVTCWVSAQASGRPGGRDALAVRPAELRPIVGGAAEDAPERTLPPRPRHPCRAHVRSIGAVAASRARRGRGSAERERLKGRRHMEARRAGR